MSYLNALRILTFNTWLLRTPLGFDLAKDVEERFVRLPESLAETGADIICLQEVWCPKLRASLSAKMAALAYPFSLGSAPKRSRHIHPLWAVREHFGNGLMIYSRFPIVAEHTPLEFRAFTRLDEFFIRKGAVCAEVQISKSQKLLVCNSHLGAVSFSSSARSYNRAHELRRLRQSFELIKWIQTIEKPAPLFLAVDLNVHFQTWQRDRHAGGFAREVSLLLSDRIKKFPLKEVSIELGIHHPIPEWTFDCQNPYVASGFFGHLPNEVTDYLFYREIGGWAAQGAHRVFVPVGASTLAPGKGPLSDHYGILAKFERISAERS
jgi:endonuclease/exonuclease/phosphatase family metal-dependent hydrolase